MGLRRFTKPKFLEQIGRDLLGRLLDQYGPELNGHGLVLPEATLDDRAYYGAVARLAVSPKGLPDGFYEVLHSIEALANPEGKARLLRALEESSDVQLERRQEATHADFAVQVLLAEPKLFARIHDQARILALSSFESHGCLEPTDRRGTFAAPDAAVQEGIKGDLDDWLAEEREGEERVTEIEMHELQGAFWFLIRRGDAFARIPTVEGRSFTVRHLRPARDLVVVYAPERDELRVHGRTAGEKRAIRRIFGQRLFGDPEYFCLPKAFTLLPLREEGPEALVAPAESGIERIVLTRLEVSWSDEHDTRTVWTATDLLASATANGREAVPPRGRLVMAGFMVHFNGQKKPRMVCLYAGNRMRVTRHCDAAAVNRWLDARGFRSATAEPVNRLVAAHGVDLVRN